MAGERGERRKDIPPAGIDLGHKLKKFMTVILLRWGAIDGTVTDTGK